MSLEKVYRERNFEETDLGDFHPLARILKIYPQKYNYTSKPLNGAFLGSN